MTTKLNPRNIVCHVSDFIYCEYFRTLSKAKYPPWLDSPEDTEEMFSLNQLADYTDITCWQLDEPTKITPHPKYRQLPGQLAMSVPLAIETHLIAVKRLVTSKTVQSQLTSDFYQHFYMQQLDHSRDQPQQLATHIHIAIRQHLQAA
jgi:hypothetical protein